MSENLKAIKNGTEINAARSMWFVNQRLASHPNSTKCQPNGMTAALFGPAPHSTYHCCNLNDCQETLTALFGHISLSNPYNFNSLTLYLYLMVL